MEEILKVIYAFGGVVFGGYLRDTIAGVQPTDVDMVIDPRQFELLTMALTNYGYQREEDDEADYKFIPTMDGLLSIQVIVIEADQYSGPPTEPDFDINLLAFDGVRLYNWMSLSIIPELWVPNIVTRIVNKQMLLNKANFSPERQEKMLKKGYTIIGEFEYDGYESYNIEYY